MSDCLFCAIAAGSVAASDAFFPFEDGPRATGRRLATAMVAGLGAQGSFVCANNVVSQSVPHLHLHVIPRTKGDGLRGFLWPRVPYDSPQEMAEYAARLRSVL